MVLRAITAGWIASFLIGLVGIRVFARFARLDNYLFWLFAAGIPVAFVGVNATVGWIVSRVGGAQWRAALLTYATSTLMYGTVDFVWQRFAYARQLHFDPFGYVFLAWPLLLLFVITSGLRIVAVFCGGGLLGPSRPVSR